MTGEPVAASLGSGLLALFRGAIPQTAAWQRLAAVIYYRKQQATRLSGRR